MKCVPRHRPNLVSAAKSPSQAGQVLVRLVRLGLDALAPDGLLAVFSCAPSLAARLGGLVRRASADAQVVAQLGAGLDHPSLASGRPDLRGMLLRRC